MFAPNRIVIGVEMPETRPWNASNLAAPSRLAVRHAFELAEGLVADVCLVSVLPEMSSGLFGSAENADQLAEEQQAEARAVLEDLEREYCDLATTPPTVSNIVATGQPWFEILKAAGTEPRTMIVCGTREKSAVSRFLFGSTGLKLLRNAAGPVLLVKPRIDDDAELDVLAATDLTETGQDVMSAGVALGQNLPVRLNLLHVLDDDLDRHIARAGAPEEEIQRYKKEARDNAESTLHEQLETTDYRTIEKGIAVHFAEGRPDLCILTAIENLDIDLLVMATSGRGGIPGMLFGNTAERLLPELPCSLLAIKPDDFQCPLDLS